MKKLLLAFLLVTGVAHAQLTSVTTCVANKIPSGISNSIKAVNVRTAINDCVVSNLSTIPYTGSVSTTSDVSTSGKFIGDGSLLTNLPARTGSGTVGGLNTQVQFNDNGNFNGGSGFTYTSNTASVAVTGSISSTGGINGTGLYNPILYGGSAGSSNNANAVSITINKAQTGSTYGGVMQLIQGANMSMAPINSGLSTSTTPTMVIDPTLLSIEGQNAMLDFSTQTSGTYLQVNQRTAVQFGQAQHSYSNFGIVGAGRNTSTTAIEFNNDAGSGSDRFTAYNLRIKNVGTAFTFKNHSYLENLYGVSLDSVGRCYEVLSGFADYGENMSANNSVCFSGGQAIFMNNVNGVFYVRGGSIDYMSSVIDKPMIDVSSGRVVLDQVHVEAGGTTFTSPPVRVQAGSFNSFLMDGGMILNTTAFPFAAGAQSYFEVGANATLQLNNVRMHRLAMGPVPGSTYPPTLISGTGSIIMTGNTFAPTGSNGMPDMLADISNTRMNAYIDGGFESASDPSNTSFAKIKDLMWVSDTNVTSSSVGSIISGTHISLSVSSTVSGSTGGVSSTWSLAATRVSSTATPNGFFVGAAITPGRTYGGTFWYNNPNTQSQDLQLFGYYMNISGFYPNGLPIITRMQAINSNASNIIGGGSPNNGWFPLNQSFHDGYLSVGSNTKSPEWANYFAMYFAIGNNGRSGNNIYFDNFIWDPWS